MTIDNKYEMGERIRICRNRKHLTQAKLAEAIDISINAISNIENGNSNASLENVRKIAEFFNVSLDYLTSGNAQSLEDESFIRRYLSLSDRGKKQMLSVMDTFFPDT